MTLQNIRRYYEEPVLAAAALLNVPVRVENMTESANDADSQFLVTRLSFGLFNEPALGCSIENIRGSFVIDYYGPKGIGPGTAQTVLTEVMKAVYGLVTRPAQRVNGVLGTVGQANGPSFTPLDEQPYFFGTVSFPIVASYKEP